MNWFMVEIYRMSPVRMCVVCALTSQGFGMLERRLCCRSWWRRLLWILLILWTFAVLQATVAGRETGNYEAFRMIPLHSYREVMDTGRGEILRSSFMNVLLFFPAGLLAGGLLCRDNHVWARDLAFVVLIALFSTTIELLQFYLHLGNGEIDDILHNTLGAWLGLCSRLWFRQKKTDHPAG
jgi:glycopeptide antibiotics resistance protein